MWAAQEGDVDLAACTEGGLGEATTSVVVTEAQAAEHTLWQAGLALYVHRHLRRLPHADCFSDQPTVLDDEARHGVLMQAVAGLLTISCQHRGPRDGVMCSDAPCRNRQEHTKMEPFSVSVPCAEAIDKAPCREISFSRKNSRKRKVGDTSFVQTVAGDTVAVGRVVKVMCRAGRMLGQGGSQRPDHARAQVPDDSRLTLRVFPLTHGPGDRTSSQVFEQADRDLGGLEGCVARTLFSKVERLASLRKVPCHALVEDLERKAAGFFVTLRQMTSWLDEMLAVHHADQHRELMQALSDAQKAFGNQNMAFVQGSLAFQESTSHILSQLLHRDQVGL